MTDMALPPVPQPQIQVKAVKAPPQVVDDAQESKPDQGFANVLKSRMDTDAPPKEATEAAIDTPDNGTTEPENVTQNLMDDGKPLPQDGKPEDVLLAVLTGTASMAETSTAETAEAAATETTEPAAAVVSAESEVMVDAYALLNVDAPADVRGEAVVGAVPGQTERGSGTSTAAARPQLAPWTTGARAELPQTAQAAVAQAVRALPVETEATQSSPFLLERFGAEVRVLAGAQPHAAGVDAFADRLLGSTQPTVASAHATTQGMPNLQPQDAAAAARLPLPTATVETPLRQPGWDQALGERVMWVVNNKFQGVELKLNPAHLGPIEVRVQMQNDQAQVSFVAQHAPVREALEAALPRLREMFGANGFNLADVNVSQHSFAEQQRHAQTAEGNFRAGTGTADETDLGSIAQQEFTRGGGQSRGAIDLFA